MDNGHDYIFKVIIIGDDGCGKTSLVNRYTNMEGLMEEQSTIGVDFAPKYYTSPHGKKIKLYLWVKTYSGVPNSALPTVTAAAKATRNQQ